MWKRAELLAPAGNYQGFIGAINAGADAVYLAGPKYGARAYADNFTIEEVCRAIRFAHLYRRKVYLAVNILLKEEEMKDLYSYLLPFYEEGLDAVILQDIGAFHFIKEYFPGMELHVSTQMAVTGAAGAKLLKEMGADRIVPARELSLLEIAEIKKQACVEIETFIHGAMCYSYSGCCLFSSILGGRSGNRGRCAQPCRLPYDALKNGRKLEKGGNYLLSLKDMCTMELVPELLEAGIDSFKIEGRMKRPEYAAGVTALYRKYIDLYYENPEDYRVSAADMDMIRSLYIRSELQEGYYKQHNSGEMLTIQKPGYSGTDEKMLKEIQAQYLEAPEKRIPVHGRVIVQAGSPSVCDLECADREACVRVLGGIAEEATKRPLEEEAIRKQMLKTGSSFFEFHNLEIEILGSVFMPVSALNELRREAMHSLEDKLLSAYGRKGQSNSMETVVGYQELSGQSGKAYRNQKNTALCLSAVVFTKEQFLEVLASECIQRIYLSADLLFEGSTERCVDPLKIGMQNAGEYSGETKRRGKELYLSLPYIVRSRSRQYMEWLKHILESKCADGILVRNLETLALFKEYNTGYSGKIIGDASLYCFNKWSKEALLTFVDGLTASYELNEKELYRLGLSDTEIPVYGRIPMMITANCIQNTVQGCIKEGGDKNPYSSPILLKDRYDEEFPVINNCRHCYNVIYNTKPSSLHQYLHKFEKYGAAGLRLDFTIEKAGEVRKVISFFEQVMKQRGEEKIKPPYPEYTKGHLGRGVE